MKRTLVLRKNEVAKMRKAGIDEGTRMLIVRLAMFGMSNKAIMTSTGATKNQIYSAQKWGNVRKIDYRDGVNPIGKHVVRKLENLADSTQLKHLERLLLK